MTNRAQGPGLLRRALASSLAWIIALSMLGALAGAALGFRMARNSTATASVLVNPLAGNPFYPGSRGEDLVNLQSEAALLVSDPVAELVATSEGSDQPPWELLSGLSVDVPPNTQIVAISYTHSSAEVAVRRAQAFAESFLAFRAQRTKRSLDSRTATIQAELSERNDELARLVTEQATAGEGGARAQLLAEQVRAVGAQIGELRTRLTDLSTGSSDPGLIITPASVETSRIPVWATLGVLGLLGGLLLGVGLGVFRGHRRGIVRDRSDIEACGVEVLARLRAAELDEIAAVDPAELATVPVGPGVKRVRAHVLAESDRRPWVVMIAAAADSGDTPPAGVAGIGVALAQSRLSTIIVDLAGSGRGVLADFDIRSGAGLLQALDGQRASDLLVDVAPGLRLLRFGEVSGDPDALLASDGAATVLTALRGMADVVLVAGSVLGGARSRSWLRWVDSVVVEVADGSTTRDQVLSSVDAVDPDKLIGAILLTGTRHRPLGRKEARNVLVSAETASPA